MISDLALVDIEFAEPARQMSSGFDSIPIETISHSAASLLADEALTNGFATSTFQGSNEFGEGGLVEYYGPNSVVGVSISDFVRSGGVQASKEPIVKGQEFAEVLGSMFPERVTWVEVGPYKGAMTHADPDLNGIRTHNLYWNDGKSEFSIIWDRPGAQVVNLGRSIACSSG